MAKNKIIEIDRLSKYIRYINKLQNVSYYRGEGDAFPSRQASALRPYEFRWNSAEPYPFMKMIDEFYKETAHKLNEDKIDFIAFAQHHGVPTNLLDISTSPLTALYFACLGEQDVDGVVYIGSDEYIDITDLIHRYPNENLIECVFANTINELELLVPLFKQFKKDYPDTFSFLMGELIRCYLYYFSSPFGDKEQAFYKKLKRKKFDVWECIAYLQDAFEEVKEFPLELCDEELYFYLVLQFVFFKKVLSYTEPIHSINFLPNMSYQPIMKFERSRNQQGLFLYQGYLTYIEPVYNFRVLTKQHLYFQNIELHIKNKATILKELDKIGINKKTLFCDYDSIAQYITDKYSVIKEDNKLN